MIENYREPTEHAKINVFAIRCFRDTADLDYIAARLAMRSRLGTPFLWSASQAVEKYLKCILFLHRANTKDLSHNLEMALERINNTLPFAIELKPSEQKLFQHLAQWNSDRYLLTSFILDNDEIFALDSLVWKLRQYCQALNKRHYADEPSQEILKQRVAEVEKILKGSNTLIGHLPGGVLEGILEKRDHAAHNALIWKNHFYSRTVRKTIRFRSGFQAVNAPLFLNPELAETVSQWMKIPQPVLAGAKQLAARKLAEVKKR